MKRIGVENVIFFPIYISSMLNLMILLIFPEKNFTKFAAMKTGMFVFVLICSENVYSKLLNGESRIKQCASLYLC